MPNPTGPTAAEGMSKPTFADLESDVCDLPLAAGVALQLICNKLFNPPRGQDYVSIGRHEAEVIEHALMNVENRATLLSDRFRAILEGRDETPTQDEGKSHPADTLNAHMAGAVKSYGPSLADQVRAQMGRSVFHDDEGQPLGEATEPKPEPDIAPDLENLTSDANMFATLQNWLVCEILGGALRDDGFLHVSNADRDLLVFTSGKARAAAGAVEDAYTVGRFGR